MKYPGIVFFFSVSLAGACAACGSAPADAPAHVIGDEADSGGDTAPADATDASDSSVDAADAHASGDEEDASEDASDAAQSRDANGPPFSCGPSQQCFEVTQFCGQVTGPHGGVFFDCDAVPTACATDVSCACLASQGISSPCTESDGGITVVATEP